MSYEEFKAAAVEARREVDKATGHPFHASFAFRLALPFSYVLAKTSLTAPQALVLMLAAGLVGAACLTTANKPWMLVGVALLYAAQVIDVIDGVIYRYRGVVAIRGAYLDRFNHTLIYPFTYGCLGVAAYRETGEWVYIVLGLLANQFKEALESMHAYETRLVDQHPESLSMM